MVTIFRDHFFCLLTSERGRFWSRVPSKEQGKGPPERTKRAVAVSRTEAAALRQEAVHSLWSRLFCGPLKMHRVPQKPVLRTEYLFRTRNACFLHRMPLKMHRVPEEAFLSTEYPSRTRNACFLHRMPQKMRRVPQKPVLRTECVFRTVEARFWHGALPKTHRTRLSGAQESGWQLPLRGLSTLGRGRGKGPPETSSALAGRRKWWKGPERTK